MAKKLHSLAFLISFLFLHHHHLILQTAATTDSALGPIATIPFNQGFSPLFGDANIKRSDDGAAVRLHLDQFTGSGFKSSDLYNHGFFSAKIKLPSDYTAGVVVAFYTSNQELFQKTHDELDFEFLGNIRGKAWRFQTNMYGNGSTHRGREERYYLWFDPSKEFHRYSILWTTSKIIFYIDDVPIREIVRHEAMGADYPSKPMALYATIWDASDWATSGGRYRTNYKYAPFVAHFTDLALDGCAVDPLEEVFGDRRSCDGEEDQLALETANYNRISPRQRAAMARFRQKHMYYAYCYDSVRYPVAPPECVVDPVEKQRFKETGRLDMEAIRRRRRYRNKGRNKDLGTKSRYGDPEDQE